MRVLLVADTHLGALDGPRLIETLGGLVEADAIIHAGDITDGAVLEALAQHAPVHAVLGNNDRGMALPERLVIDIGGCAFGVVHDSGQAAGRAQRLRQWFPTADVVVFGHSHLPWHECDVDASGHVQHHVNPGSAIQRRRAPQRTVAVVDVDAGQVTGIRHVPLP